MNFRISDDLRLIRDFFQLSREELSEELGIDVKTLARRENGETYPRAELIDKFYRFCFEQGLRLNHQKEMLYKDDLDKNHILLMHA